MEELAQQEEGILTPSNIESYVRFAQVLKRIHIRLMAEGYEIKDGVFTPPALYLEDLHPLKKIKR